MRRFFDPRQAPAMAVAMLALIVAIGGTALGQAGSQNGRFDQAAAKKKKSTGDAKTDAKQIKKLAGTLTVKHAGSADSATNAANAASAANATDTAKLGGKPAASFLDNANVRHATVDNNGSTASIARGTAGIGAVRLGPGVVGVTFPDDITNCTWVATVDGVSSSEIVARKRPAHVDQIEVFTYDGANAALDTRFHIAVLC